MSCGTCEFLCLCELDTLTIYLWGGTKTHGVVCECEWCEWCVCESECVSVCALEASFASDTDLGVHLVAHVGRLGALTRSVFERA